jgi:hypothetical protein
MTDREKIMEAARTVWSAGDMYIGPSVESLEAFYRAAQAEAFEQAARACMQQCRVIEEPHEFERCAEAIRALKEKE